MSEQYRRRLWGYRPGSVIQMVSDINHQIDVLNSERAQHLEVATSRLQTQEDEKLLAERRLTQIQAEYFQLTGELNHMTQRSQVIVEDAKARMTEEELALKAEIVAREERLNQMRQRLYHVPIDLRHLIEKLTASIVSHSSRPESIRIQDVGLDPSQATHDSDSSRGISGART